MQQQVTLAPGQSQQVAFNVVPQATGVYQVNLDSLSGTFTVMGVEEQSLYTGWIGISQSPSFPRWGQKLTIPGRTITRLGIRLSRTPYTEGNITFTIRRASDDSLLQSKVWGNVNLLPLHPSSILAEVIFDNPVLIAGEVYILVENPNPQLVYLYGTNYDIKPGECMADYGWWPDEGRFRYSDNGKYDLAYRYTYI